MTVDKETFVRKLLDACPGAAGYFDEHLEEFEGEVLLHLLVADTLRYALDLFDGGDLETLERCLDVVAEGLESGDEYVANAISVSFVEDTPWWDTAREPFMARWPSALRDEAERWHQAGGNPG